ncbi:hypothetical protein HDU76_013647 [Blyttiomyces sp. JEL0837]|nr:hypothetical protein HDU76_013647 [Blyttiomyces sp. JEL0837]
MSVATFGWKHLGKVRPLFALPTLPNQESVWDYPRPPAIRPDSREILVVRKDSEQVLAKSNSTIRICETAGPPCFYIPRKDVRMDLLEQVIGKTSICEWKGNATYWKIAGSEDIVGWSYETPNNDYSAIKGYLSFYAGKVIAKVGDEAVVPQPSDFYGGWVTSEIIGPFKGDPIVTDIREQ